MKLTKAIIYAAAMDAAVSAKRRGEDQEDAYFAVFEKLFALIGGEEGWMDLPAQ